MDPYLQSQLIQCFGETQFIYSYRMFRLVCLLIGRIIGVNEEIHRKTMPLWKFIGLFELGWGDAIGKWFEFLEFIFFFFSNTVPMRNPVFTLLLGPEFHGKPI